MDSIVGELKKERDRTNRAIAALDGSAVSSAAPKPRLSARIQVRRRGLTPEGRRRLSQAMKRRWAERRRRAT